MAGSEPRRATAVPAPEVSLLGERWGRGSAAGTSTATDPGGRPGTERHKGPGRAHVPTPAAATTTNRGKLSVVERARRRRGRRPKPGTAAGQETAGLAEAAAPTKIRGSPHPAGLPHGQVGPVVPDVRGGGVHDRRRSVPPGRAAAAGALRRADPGVFGVQRQGLRERVVRAGVVGGPLPGGRPRAAAGAAKSPGGVSPGSARTRRGQSPPHAADRRDRPVPSKSAPRSSKK
jgi:hypothetical protein